MANIRAQKTKHRRSTRKAENSKPTIEKVTEEATEDLERSVRAKLASLDDEAARQLLTLHRRTAECVLDVVTTAITAIQRATFIPNESTWSKLPPRRDFLVDKTEDVDEDKVILDIINKQNGTNLTQNELVAVDALADLKKGDAGSSSKTIANLADTSDECVNNAANILMGLVSADKTLAQDTAATVHNEKSANQSLGDVWNSTFPVNLTIDSSRGTSTDLIPSDSVVHDQDAPPNAALEDVWDSTFPGDPVNNPNTGCKSHPPCTLPPREELKLYPLIKNFKPQQFPNDTDAGPNYTKVAKKETDREARVRGEDDSKTKAQAENTKAYSQMCLKRPLPQEPDFFEEDDYPFHKFKGEDDDGFGGDLGLGPEEVKKKNEAAGNIPSGKPISRKRQKRS